MRLCFRCREWRGSEAGLLELEAPARYSEFAEGTIARISSKWAFDMCVEEKFEVYGEFSRSATADQTTPLNTTVSELTVDLCVCACVRVCALMWSQECAPFGFGGRDVLRGPSDV